MKSKSLAILLVLAVAFPLATLQADFVILDMNPATAPVAGSPPGPGTGFESSIKVFPGSTVTVVAYFVPSTPGVIFDSFGVDLNFGAPGDMATAAPIPLTTLAGTTAGFGVPMAIDLIAAPAATVPGMVLATGAVGPLAPFSGSLGGLGYYDATMGSDFMGMGFMPAVGMLFDIHGQDFMITGIPGEFVTLMPSGIFDTGVGTTMGLSTDLRPLATGGDALYNQATGMTTAVTFIGGTIIIIPEPAGASLLGLVGVGLLIRRRRN